MDKIEKKHEKIPLNLDKKDKKILSNLFDNARTPISKIAKSVRLSKEVVNYRIKRLIGQNLLVGFNTVIDIKRIGWEMFYVYIRFRNIDVEKENEILEFLKNHENIAQLFKTIGNYDAIIKVFVKDYTGIEEIMKNIEDRFKENIETYSVDFIDKETAVPFSFLYTSEKNKKSYLMKKEQGKVELSKTDLKILKTISKNARIPLTEIANKLKISRDIIKYHLKKLEKNKVILKYRPDTLPKRLGYNWYFLILKVGKLTQEISNTLETYLLNQENVTYFYKTVGSSDMQVELRIKTSTKLNEVLMQLRSILKTVLKRHEMLMILDELKYTYFPERLMGG